MSEHYATADIRALFSIGCMEADGSMSQADDYIVFDAWLREERALAWDEGFDAGERDVLMHETESWDAPCIKNPYRDEETR